MAIGDTPRPGQNIVKKQHSDLEQQVALVELPKLADEFASVCAVDLDKNLTSAQIKTKLIEKGFPAGLANYLGESLLERITDARLTLAVAATKPKLKDSLVETVKEEVMEYFKSRETEIVRYIDVAQDPVSYLKIVSEAFNAVDTGNLSDEELEKAFEAVQRLGKEGKKKLCRPITQYMLEFCLSKGWKSAKMVSDTEIVFNASEAPGYHHKETQDEVFYHIKKRFPNASAGIGGTGGMIGGSTLSLTVSYHMSGW